MSHRKPMLWSCALLAAGIVGGFNFLLEYDTLFAHILGILAFIGAGLEARDLWRARLTG